MSDRALICLGANASDAELQIAAAFDFLSQRGDVLRTSGVYPSDPEYSCDAASYLNCIVELSTPLDYSAMQSAVKDYEREVRAHGQPGFVAVDIDIVMWNDTLLRPADASSRYFAKGMQLM